MHESWSRGWARGGGEGCPPPRSADGVIASAQIEYISYVFITTARYVVPLSATHPRPPPPSPTYPFRGRVTAVEGRKVGRRKTEDTEPRRARAEQREREMAEGMDVYTVCRGLRLQGMKGEVGRVGGGHGKSSVRRYRLTDVRLSVVKR